MVKKVKPFYWRSGLFLLVELHREGSAPAACAAGLLSNYSQWISQPFPPTALRRRHAQIVRDSTSSYKIDNVIVIKNFLNPKGHQNTIGGCKGTAILLKGWIWSIGGVASGRDCACSLHSRLVHKLTVCCWATLVNCLMHFSVAATKKKPRLW